MDDVGHAYHVCSLGRGPVPSGNTQYIVHDIKMLTKPNEEWMNYKMLRAMCAEGRATIVRRQEQCHL